MLQFFKPASAPLAPLFAALFRSDHWHLVCAVKLLGGLPSRFEDGDATDRP